MEDHYATFKKLNRLLEDSFEAERLYYNAGEDVQEVNLKRFFNHETVKRNRFSHEISELLVHAGIEPKKQWVQKGNLDRDWKEEKRVLTGTKPLEVLDKCTSKDRENLNGYEEILADSGIPKEVSQTLTRQHKGITQSLEEAEKFRTSAKGLSPESTPKVRKLKAI